MPHPVERGSTEGRSEQGPEIRAPEQGSLLPRSKGGTENTVPVLKCDKKDTQIIVIPRVWAQAELSPHCCYPLRGLVSLQPGSLYLTCLMAVALSCEYEYLYMSLPSSTCLDGKNQAFFPSAFLSTQYSVCHRVGP